MIIKIKFEHENEQIEKVYECSDYQVTKQKDQLIFSLNRETYIPTDNIAIIIDGELPRRIYIINEAGKTVDTYYWQEKNRKNIKKGIKNG
jgi:hypothetical protein